MKKTKKEISKKNKLKTLNDESFRERKLKYNKTYFKNRYKTDDIFKISIRIRKLISNSFRNNNTYKNTKTFKIIGCTTIEFKKYLEKKFTNGMSWNNYGYGYNKWNIDHIIPIAIVKEENSYENKISKLIELNHYTNLQPMWQPENQKKSCKIL